MDRVTSLQEDSGPEVCQRCCKNTTCKETIVAVDQNSQMSMSEGVESGGIEEPRSAMQDSKPRSRSSSSSPRMNPEGCSECGLESSAQHSRTSSMEEGVLEIIDMTRKRQSSEHGKLRDAPDPTNPKTPPRRIPEPPKIHPDSKTDTWGLSALEDIPDGTTISGSAFFGFKHSIKSPVSLIYAPQGSPGVLPRGFPDIVQDKDDVHSEHDDDVAAPALLVAFTSRKVGRAFPGNIRVEEWTGRVVGIEAGGHAQNGEYYDLEEGTDEGDEGIARTSMGGKEHRTQPAVWISQTELNGTDCEDTPVECSGGRSPGVSSNSTDGSTSGAGVEMPAQVTEDSSFHSEDDLLEGSLQLNRVRGRKP